MSESDRLVAGWYDAVRAGRPISWSAYLADPRPSDTAVLVGAAHLELVRRLAERLGDHDTFPALADRVIDTPAFGRGRVDIPLPVPGIASSGGPTPMDPASVPAGELLRVAVPVLAGLLHVAPVPDPRRRRRSGPRVVVHGNPGLAQPVERALRAAGVREGGRTAHHVVLVAPVDAAVFAMWTARVGSGASLRWRRIWDTVSDGRPLPPGVDPTRILATLDGRVRRDRIHLVVADGPSAAAGRVGDLLGVGLDVPEAPSWARVDLARWLNWFHTARLEREERAVRVAALLEAPGGIGVPAVPAGRRSWAEQAATLVRDRLVERASRDGYAVHGDLEEVGRLVGAAVDARQATGPASTLEAAIEAIAAGWVR